MMAIVRNDLCEACDVETKQKSARRVPLTESRQKCRFTYNIEHIFAFFNPHSIRTALFAIYRIDVFDLNLRD